VAHRRKWFSPQTKAKAVRAVVLRGEPVADVAWRFRASDSTIRRWVKEANQEAPDLMDLYARRYRQRLEFHSRHLQAESQHQLRRLGLGD